MYKIYFKQAIEILKLNKFVSIITIVGTALSIMMIMVIVVTESVKTASIGPESNRDRTVYIKYYTKTARSGGGMQSGNINPYDMFKNYLSDFTTPEYTSAVDDDWAGGSLMVKKDKANERMLKQVKQIDASYWKIMTHTFVSGRAFSQEEFESGLKNAVITDVLAKEVFGNDDPLGKDVEIDFKEYKVIGVVKNVSQTFTYAYADAYIPYTSQEEYNRRPYSVLYLLKNKSDKEALIEEVRAAERKHNAVDEWDIVFRGPYTHKDMLISKYSNEEPDFGTATRKMVFIFAILLLIPAVNLSSFSMSRVKKRMEEIGIRKAFGAKKSIIMIQVLYENLITSLIGGVIGLIFSYIVIFWLKQWLLGVEANSSVPIEALVSWPVFLMAFLACFILNLLSAGLPAYRAARVAIVDSLTQKDN